MYYKTISSLGFARFRVASPVEEGKFHIKLIFKTCYPKWGSGIALSFSVAKVCLCLLHESCRHDKYIMMSGHTCIPTALAEASRTFYHLAMMWCKDITGGKSFLGGLSDWQVSPGGVTYPRAPPACSASTGWERDLWAKIRAVSQLIGSQREGVRGADSNFLHAEALMSSSHSKGEQRKYICFRSPV